MLLKVGIVSDTSRLKGTWNKLQVSYEYQPSLQKGQKGYTYYNVRWIYIHDCYAFLLFWKKSGVLNSNYFSLDLLGRGLTAAEEKTLQAIKYNPSCVCISFEVCQACVCSEHTENGISGTAAPHMMPFLRVWCEMPWLLLLLHAALSKSIFVIIANWQENLHLMAHFELFIHNKEKTLLSSL